MIYCRLIILLLLIIGCKQNGYKSTSQNNSYQTNDSKTNNVNKTESELKDSCKISLYQTEVMLLRDQLNKSLYYLKVKNSNSELEKVLDFSDEEFTDIKLVCKDTSFIISLQNNFGNNYWFTHLTFEINKELAETLITRIYRSESNRNGTYISGKNLNKKTLLKDFKINLLDSIKTTQIYSFEGFQEEKEPEIKQYFDLIKNLSQENRIEELKLAGNKFVLNYILEKITLKSSNLSQYNDIGYYLERSKIYDEAIYVLEKVVEKFPKRTVAYINLGDAYWGLGDQSKAKEAYKKYTVQMEKKNKSGKIPPRVRERIN